MTTVPPPTSPAVQLLQPAAAPPVVTIVQPPPALALLASGTMLPAVVIPNPPAPPDGDAKPAVTLRTPAGDVTVRLPVPIPAGTEVELQVVRANDAQATLRLVTIDDQPAQQALAQLRQAAQQPAPQVQTQAPQTPAPPAPVLPNVVVSGTPVPPAAAWTPAGPVPLPNLGTISGLVLTATEPVVLAPIAPEIPVLATPLLPGATLPIIQTPFQLLAGADVGLRILSVEMPTIQGATLMTPQGQAMPLAAVITPPVPAAAQPAAVGIGAPPQAIFDAVYEEIAAAPQAPPTIAPVTTPVIQTQSAPVIVAVTGEPAAPVPKSPAMIVASTQGLPTTTPAPPAVVVTPEPLTTLTGTVTANRDAIPVIVTPAGEIQINARANLPIGARVTIEIVAQGEPLPSSAPPIPAASLPLSGPAGAQVGWPTLSESLAVLQRADPQAAVQLAEAIPDGGPRTTVALISFVQAMRSGEARQWPGDATLRALERIGPRGSHLAAQLSEEVSTLSTRARDVGSEWRALPVPWNADGRVDRIALITRREEPSDDAAAKKKGAGGGVRFLINLDLSRLGSMQLDGMFRKESRGFDVMIRTKAALPETMRSDLTGLFAASNAAMGLKGGLTFQVVKKFPDPVSQAGPMAMEKPGIWA